jgi:hypothetical protein
MAAFVTEEEDYGAFIIKCEGEDVSAFSEVRFDMNDENGELTPIMCAFVTEEEDNGEFNELNNKICRKCIICLIWSSMAWRYSFISSNSLSIFLGLLIKNILFSFQEY